MSTWSLPQRRGSAWRAYLSFMPALPCQTRSNTTVTVTDLPGTEECRRGVQDGADAVPESVLTPALIPAVGGMPGAVGCRHFAPRDASVHDPEQALEQAPVRHSRTATWWFLRWQERCDLLPEGVAERRGPGQHDRERRGGGSAEGLPRRAPGDMPLTGAGLVLPTPLDPVEPDTPPGRLRLVQEPYQAPHLGDGQRNAGAVAERSPPFPSCRWPWRALRRVTSSRAWASRAKVM
jgi:hypothetical protein